MKDMSIIGRKTHCLYLKRIIVFAVCCICILAFSSIDVLASDDALQGFNEEDMVYEQSVESVFRPECPSFSDVDFFAWYRYYVNSVASRKIMNGYPDGTFRPSNQLTRAEAVVILANAYAGYLGNTSSTPFNDISNHWARDEIVWAYNMNIVNGTGSGNFSPNAYVTRQDFAVMVVRYCINAEIFTLPTYSSKITYADDASIASYAKDSVYKLQTARVINDGTSLRFYPTNNITRAEVAKIMYNIYFELEKSGYELSADEEGVLLGANFYPTLYKCRSEFCQIYRKTSDHITFYYAYSICSIAETATRGLYITLYPGDYCLFYKYL